MSLRSESAPSAKDAARFARARSSLSLGAAFALFCLVLTGYDMRASQAAGGFFEAVFGPAAEPAWMYAHSYGPSHRARRAHEAGRRHAQHAKRRHVHVAQARRHLTERHRVASLARGRPALNEPRRSSDFEVISFSQGAVSKAVAASAERAGGVSRRAVCVRACDGYYFPAPSISRGAEIAAQQGNCEKLCPGAQSALFVLPAGSEKVAEAKSAKSGETYAHLLARLDPNDARTRSCSCQTEASAATAADALLKDATLRPGDTVVTPQGVRVLKRGSRYPFKSSDFLSLAETRDAPLSNRSALYAIERVLKTPQGRLAVANADHRRRRHED